LCMNHCVSCNNVAPSGCANNSCADHCKGCGVHRTKMQVVEPKTTRLQPKMRTKQQADDAEDDEMRLIEQALQLSLQENEMIEQALKSSLFEAQVSFQNKLETIKSILPDASEESIVAALKDCNGDQTSAIEQLLLAAPEPSENKPLQTTTSAPIAISRTTTTTTTSVSSSPAVTSPLSLSPSSPTLELESELEEVQKAMESIDRELKNQIYENECIVCLEEGHLRRSSCDCCKLCKGCWRKMRKRCPVCLRRVTLK